MVKNPSNKSLRRLNKIGEGGYGNIYLYYDEVNQKELAVKEIEFDEKGIPSLIEAYIMTSIIHPSLVFASDITIQNKKIAICQEPARCDLGDWCRKKKNLPAPHLLRYWAHSLVQAVACLHYHNIVHGDVKAKNILLFNNDSIRLTDFGLSQKFFSGIHLNYRACTTTHRPLEIWLGENWDSSIDIWALGCTLFEIAYGEYLIPYQGWDGEVSKNLLKERFICALDDLAKFGPGGAQKIPFKYNRNKVTYLSYQLPTNFHSSDYSVFNSLVLSMLRFDPLERPTINQVLQHPYFQNFVTVPHRRVNLVEEPLPPHRYRKYLTELSEYTTNQPIIELTFSLLRKIQHLRFRFHSFEEDEVRLIGAFWIASKLVTRKPPSLPFPPNLLFQIERKICEYLSFHLL